MICNHGINFLIRFLVVVVVKADPLESKILFLFLFSLIYELKIYFVFWLVFYFLSKIFVFRLFYNLDCRYIPNFNIEEFFKLANLFSYIKIKILI